MCRIINVASETWCSCFLLIISLFMWKCAVDWMEWIWALNWWVTYIPWEIQKIPHQKKRTHNLFALDLFQHDDHGQQKILLHNLYSRQHGQLKNSFTQFYLCVTELFFHPDVKLWYILGWIEGGAWLSQSHQQCGKAPEKKAVGRGSSQSQQSKMCLLGHLQSKTLFTLLTYFRNIIQYCPKELMFPYYTHFQKFLDHSREASSI